jgi:hypothetical protein
LPVFLFPSVSLCIEANQAAVALSVLHHFHVFSSSSGLEAQILQEIHCILVLAAEFIRNYVIVSRPNGAIIIRMIVSSHKVNSTLIVKNGLVIPSRKRCGLSIFGRVLE